MMISFSKMKFKDYTFDRDVTLAVDFDGSKRKDYWLTISGLNASLYFELDGKIVKGVLGLPAGFRTDGASVPRLLKPLFPAWNKHFRAILIHDYLCEYGGIVIFSNGSYTLTRADIDNLFIDMLKLEGNKNIALIRAGLLLHRLIKRPKVNESTFTRIVIE